MTTQHCLSLYAFDGDSSLANQLVRILFVALLFAVLEVRARVAFK
jgi:hypothetical protein